MRAEAGRECYRLGPSISRASEIGLDRPSRMIVKKWRRLGTRWRRLEWDQMVTRPYAKLCSLDRSPRSWEPWQSLQQEKDVRVARKEDGGR